MAADGEKKEMVKMVFGKTMAHIVSEEEKKNAKASIGIVPVSQTIEARPNNEKGKSDIAKEGVQAQAIQSKQVDAMYGVGGQNPKFVFNDASHTLFMGENRTVNFYIVITKMHSICNDKTDQCMRTLLDCKCYVWRGNDWIEYSFEKLSVEAMMSHDFLSRMPFAVSFCKNKSDFNNFMYTYINNLIFEYQGEVVQTFETSGWRRINNTLKAYVTADGVIGYPDLRVLSGDGLRIRNIYNGSIYSEFQNMRQTLNRTEQMDVLLNYMLGQMIHTLFDEVNVGLKHILFVVGPRGSGKTAVSLCFTQLEHKNQCH